MDDRHTIDRFNPMHQHSLLCEVLPGGPARVAQDKHNQDSMLK